MIFRVEKTKDYTVMSNHHLKNKALTLKSKGLLSLILSLPDNWDYSLRGLCAICKDGQAAIASGIKELEEERYIVRQRLRNSNGTLGKIIYIVNEIPPDENSTTTPFPPQHGFPDLDKPDLDKPDLDNQAQLNTNQSSTKQVSTKPSFQDMGGVDGMEETIKTNINFEKLLCIYPGEQVLSLLENILEILCCRNSTIFIGKKSYDAALVQRRFESLQYVHADSVLSSIQENTGEIRDMKSYMLMSLFNAPTRDLTTKTGQAHGASKKRDASYDIEELERLISQQNYF